MKTLRERIEELAAVQPDKLAAAFKKETMTYGQLSGQILAMGKTLRELGVKPGDRVAFSALSKPDMIATYLGIQACGGAVVYLDKNAAPQSMALICKIAQVSLMLTDKPLKDAKVDCEVRSLRQTVAQALENGGEGFVPVTHEPEELAEMIFTSGTTGTPKGVMLSYRAVDSILHHTAEGVGIQPDERVLIPLPLCHSYGMRVLRATLWQGGTVILQNGFTFAKDVETNITQYNCTGMAAVPASYPVMRGQMQDRFAPVLGQLRYLEFGAGSLSVRQRKEICELLPKQRIINTWGSSETGGAIFCRVHELAKHPTRVGSLGRPLEDIEVRALDADGKPMAHTSRENPGRLALRGRMVMSGYWGNPEATADALRDGWLVTNDLVYMDDEGYVFMLGRADDIINTGGEKVSPIEVENVAGQFPKVRECAVIAAADDVMGQVPVMFVAAGMGYEEGAFVRYLQEKLEKYKLPQQIIPVEALPRNAMQKVNRRALREIFEHREEASLLNPTVQLILARHSVRKFKDEPIPRNILEMLVKAGYHAPSGNNMQSWRFTVVTGKGRIAALKEAAREAAEANKVHFYGFENPQALILVSNDTRNPHGCQDAACAAENIMLAALSYGIGSVWLNPLMTLRNAEPVKAVLDDYGIPAGHTVWATVALGYPLSSDQQVVKRKENVVSWVED